MGLKQRKAWVVGAVAGVVGAMAGAMVRTRATDLLLDRWTKPHPCKRELTQTLSREGGSSPSTRVALTNGENTKPKTQPGVDWENAPRVDLVTRTYAAGVKTMWETFMPTYLLFWPMSAWRSTELIVVLDAENPEDHAAGAILQNLNLLSRVRVKYEALPPEGTLCDNWRGAGYARQQYSNFYADLYTDAEYVAIVDTDAVFTGPVIPSDFFEDGKPIAKGINLVGKWQSDATRKALGGKDYVAMFMVKMGFPVIFKTSHLRGLREDIARNLGVETFEQAFHLVCDMGQVSYSQFDMMLNHMWYYRHDEYAWHIADYSSGEFWALTDDPDRRASTEPEVISKNIPTVTIMSHARNNYGSSINMDFKNILCLGSILQAGDCNKRESTPQDGLNVTRGWSVGDRTWTKTYEDHSSQVSSAGSAFPWTSETELDWIYPGRP